MLIFVRLYSTIAASAPALMTKTAITSPIVEFSPSNVSIVDQEKSTEFTLSSPNSASASASVPSDETPALIKNVLSDTVPTAFSYAVFGIYT